MAPFKGYAMLNDLFWATSTEDCKTHKQKMLDTLHNADDWHSRQAKTCINKKKKEMHHQYQTAIWWAIEQLDDEIITIKAT